MTDLLGYAVLLVGGLCVTSLFGWPLGRGRGLMVFGAGLLVLVVAFAASFDDFEEGILAFDNDDWADAVESLERVEPGARYDSARVLLGIAKRRMAAGGATGRNPGPVPDTLGVAAIGDGGAPAAAEPVAPAAARETLPASRTDRYTLSNDGRRVSISTSRDWWDDEHLRAIVAPGTPAVVLDRQRIEDVPGFPYERCRIRTTRGTPVTGWVFCGDLHPA